MLDGSPQTFLHDPILKYLDDRGVQVNLRAAVKDIVHETDAQGVPTKVNGLQISGEKDSNGRCSRTERRGRRGAARPQVGCTGSGGYPQCGRSGRGLRRPASPGGTTAETAGIAGGSARV